MQLEDIKQHRTIVEEIIQTREGKTTKDGITIVNHRIEDGVTLDDWGEVIVITTSIRTDTQQAEIWASLHYEDYLGFEIKYWDVKEIHNI